MSKSLREIEELLNNPGFFRVHQSYLVNLKRIRKIIRSDGGQVVLTDGSTLPVARGKKAELLGVIERL
ncbi:MAG: LytTR family transcriptional regulator [Haliscomenobacter sp.]|nr:LytTR family transcriptional regulator [Haliscomenobacter sp.]